MDPGPLVASVLVSLIGPTGFGGILLIRYQRDKMRGEARTSNSTADETDAKAEVLLAGEALNLFKEARADAAARTLEAQEERHAAALCRRMNVALWVAWDACDRHMRRQDAHTRELGGEPLPRPADTTPNLPTT